MRKHLALCLCLLFSSMGCTSLQLERSSVAQASTLDDIYQQQVLDNLAKIVQNTNALPHFAFPSQGSATVSDQAAINPTINWVLSGFDSLNLGAGASRGIEQSWTMDPIRDPRKLTRMRAAYQAAVVGNGWFQCGTKADIPKGCPCLPVGCYCGTYVWVPPEGRDQLTQLTLGILDIALFEPESPDIATKEVVAYFTSTGTPTTPEKAEVVVTAEIAQTQDLSSKNLFKGDLAAPLMPRIRSFGNPNPTTLLELRNQLRTVTPMRR